MEFCSGGDLKKAIDAQKRLGTPFSEDIVSICSGSVERCKGNRIMRTVLVYTKQENVRGFASTDAMIGESLQAKEDVDN